MQIGGFVYWHDNIFFRIMLYETLQIAYQKTKVAQSNWDRPSYSVNRKANSRVCKKYLSKLMHEVQVLSMNNKYTLEIASRTIHHFRLNANFSI